MQAAEIVVQIMNGLKKKRAVSFRGVEITGELDLTCLVGCHWPPGLALSFRECRFRGAVTAFTPYRQPGFSFPARVEFTRCRFAGPLGFHGCRFQQGLDCRDSSCAAQADFSGCLFTQAARFSGAHFRGGLNARATCFQGLAAFNDVDFYGYAAFADSRFLGPARFTSSRFLRYAIFSEAHFSGEVSYQAALFQGKAAFVHTHFTQTPDFSGSRFNPGIPVPESLRRYLQA